MLVLLHESGYFDAAAAVTVQRLREHFRSHVDDLAAWLRYSEGNRGAPSWYVVAPDPADPAGRWMVGRHPGDHRESYDGADMACAVYVRRWLEQLGGLQDTGNRP